MIENDFLTKYSMKDNTSSCLPAAHYAKMSIIE